MLKSRRGFAGVVAAGLILAAIGWYAMNSRKPAAQRSTAPANSPTRNELAASTHDGVRSRTPPRGMPPRSHVVDESQACRQCHAEIVQSYSASGMSQSWTPLAEPAIDQFAETSAPVHAPDGYRYHAAIRDQSVWQHETAEFSPDHHLAVQARYQVGSGRHALSLLAENQGYLNLLPLAWYAHDGNWALSPGFELRNRRFSRSVQPECIACHGGRTTVTPGSPDHYQHPVKQGISCETCHGAADQHLDFVQHRTAGDLTASDLPGHRASEVLEDAGGDGAAKVDWQIVNPGHLDAERANDVCLQCHLQGDATVYLPGAHAFSYRPGERLRDHRRDFLLQVSETDSMGVASHGARMLQSRCYTESQGQLTCVLCHDPHKAVSEVNRQTFDAGCMTCHSSDDCHRPIDPASQQQDASCVQCHMPQRSTREGQHLVFTDHRIRRPAAATSDIVSAPVIRADTTLPLVDSLPGAPEDPALLGIASIKLHETMGPQQPSLLRGMNLLQDVHRRQPDDPEIRYWLASGHISTRDGKRAVELLAPVVRASPDWVQARFRLAIAYDQLTDYPSAIQHYEQVIRDAPQWTEPYALLARLYLYRQDGRAAEQLLTQQIALKEDAEAHAALALALRLRNADLADILKHLERALQLDPRSVTALINRGFLLAEAGRTNEAEQDFRQVLQWEPGNPKAQAGLQSLRR